MNQYALYHEPKSHCAYAYDKDTLHIRLRTQANDFKLVQLIWGDPFHWVPTDKDYTTYIWKTANLEDSILTKRMSSTLYDYYQINIKPPFKRTKYAFLLTDHHDQQYLFGAKELLAIQPNDGSYRTLLQNFFNFPYLIEQDMNQSPAWVKDTVWYQIFPERFHRGSNESDSQYLPWNSHIEDISNDHRFGGDLKGIIQKLAYIKNLGVSGIYFTPIFVSPSNHKYDTTDYFNIDPEFGTNEDFRNLVQKAHEIGLKVMLDAVFNHCGIDHPFFQDVLKYGDKSQYKDCFYIHQYPVKIHTEPGYYHTDLGYATFAFSKNMPKWNTDHPIAQAHLLDVVRYWIEEYDIDAWRFDVSNEISHDFLRQAKKVAIQAKADFFLIGENWDNSNPWVAGDQFNSVMNYELYYVINKFFCFDPQFPKCKATAFRDFICNVLFEYSDNVTENMFNLLGCHDTARILRKCNDDLELVRLPFLFLFSFAGAPNIYYGDEIGITGGNDPDNRRCMCWDDARQNKSMLEFVKKLIDLRTAYPAFRTIDLEWLLLDDISNTIIYRKHAEQDIIIIMHNSDVPHEVTLPTTLQGKRFLNLMTEQPITFGKSVFLSKHQYYVLK